MADVIGFLLVICIPIGIVLLIKSVRARNKETELYDSVYRTISEGLTVEYNGFYLDFKYGIARVFGDNFDQKYDEIDEGIEIFLRKSGFLTYWSRQCS